MADEFLARLKNLKKQDEKTLEDLNSRLSKIQRDYGAESSDLQTAITRIQDSISNWDSLITVYSKGL